MPFKTRKQKESAAKHRYTFIENRVIYEVDDKREVKTDDGLKTKTAQSKKIAETVNTDAELIKIFLAASIIIGTQIILRLTLS